MRDQRLEGKPDEISLRDLFRILKRRKRVFCVVYLLVALAGLVGGWLHTPSTTVSGSFLPAGYTNNQLQYVPVVSSQTVLLHVKQNILPGIVPKQFLKSIDAFLLAYQSGQQGLAQQSATSRLSNVLGLTFKTSVKQVKQAKAQINEVLSQLKLSQAHVLKAQKAHWQLEVSQKQKEIAVQQALKVQLQNILPSLHALLFQHLKSTSAANQGGTLQGYFKSNQNVVLAGRIISLTERIHQIDAKVLSMNNSLQVLQQDIDSLQPAHFVGPVVVSANTSALMSFLLPFILALILGLVVAFFVVMMVDAVSE